MSGLDDSGDEGDPADELSMNSELVELTSLITRQIEAGECVLVEDYIHRYPDLAEPIGRIFPVICDLIRLGRR